MRTSRLFSFVYGFLALFAVLSLHAAEKETAKDYIWIESESPTKHSGLEKLNHWAHEYFSGEWLHLSVDADKLDEAVKGDAILLQYDFQSKAGEFELWNRVGFEYVRSPFDWRIDGGDWKTASPEDLTVDLMEVGFWCEIAWLKLGDVKLETGKHTLEIRLQKRKNAEGKPERLLYASDCLCLSPTPFSPYSGYKPDQDHRTEKDREAAKIVYGHQGRSATYTNINPGELNDPAKCRSAALEFSLAGTWEICRDDEMLPEPVVQPISTLPNTTRWSAIAVPGDKNVLRPDLMFAHRVWYRTKFDVPKGFVGHSGYIEFPQNNLNTTVYVNGELCGFNKNPFAKFRIDVSKAIKPGVNEIHVGIRDAWYARTEKADDPMKLRKTFNLPKKFFGDGFQDLVYPIWNHPQSGILLAPTLHFVSGPVYIDDVFVKPSVADKRLAVEITLKNVSDEDQTVELENVCRFLQPYYDKELSNQGIEGAGMFEPIPDKYFNGYHFLFDEPGIDEIFSELSDPKKSFEKKTVTVKANSEMIVNLSEKWSDPKRWTPEKPFLYSLCCAVIGKDFLSSKTVEFGFREWSIDGKNFLLNGNPFHGWADTFDKPGKEDWLKFYRESNQSMMRFWGTTWKGMAPGGALRFFDENGVVVRRSGIFDGEAIGYNVIENDPDLRAKNKAEDPDKEQIKMDLFRNWRDQMVAQVKAERNHPSVMLWSIENEILYINCVNLYGGLMDQFEDEIIKTAEAVKEVDPTRPSMVDGGGATKRGNPGAEPGDGLPVHGDHYVFKDFTKYPDRAYEATPEGGGHGNRWIWDEKRPRFIGEDFYVNGIHPSEFAAIGGEEAFSGRTGAKRSVGILYKMLTEGYRWADYGAWHFWVDQNRASDQYTSNAPIAVFCREYDWTFPIGGEIKRTMRIFNDTQKDETIRFSFDWETEDGFLAIPAGAKNSKDFDVPAGKSVEFPLTFTVPAIKSHQKGASTRGEERLVFRLNVGDGEVFHDTKEVSILQADGLHGPVQNASLMSQKGIDKHRPNGTASALLTTESAKLLGKLSLYVYDPNDSVSSWLKKRNFRFQTLESTEDISDIETTDAESVLLVGKNALTGADCDTPALQAFAAQGGRVIVLEQKFPLRYGALPCEMELAKNEGRIGFIENESHPLFESLKNKDFFTWPDGHVLYRDAYKKPVRGARSMLQCDQKLESSAVVEIPVGKGVMILSQLLVGEKLEKSVVARQLLGNMIGYAAGYRLEFTPVIVCTEGLNARLLAELDAMRLQYRTVNTPDVALWTSTVHIDGETEDGQPFFEDLPRKTTIIMAATPGNLKNLQERRKELNAFHRVGGTILLHGLTPEGLDAFNTLVGANHMIREFRRERVGFPARRHPLTQGLSLSDIAMSSGERMFGWANDEFVASDTYSYVVDLDDVAPFGKYRNDFERMMTNGMLSADGWPYIVNLPAPDGNPGEAPLDFPIEFPKEVEIGDMVWIGNTFYSPVTEISLFSDGNVESRKKFDVEPNTEPQELSFEKPVKGRKLTLRLERWTPVPGKEKTTGLDNITLNAVRDEAWKARVKPLLNIGSMVCYEMNGDGKILLCNLAFRENEAVPANAAKKRNILSTILRNLGAEFSEGKSIIAGTPLEYRPVEISKQCNGFRNEKGWFGDKNFTFAALPTGSHKFGGVPFEIYDMPTSPVPNCILIDKEKVEGIPVGEKADALFFLHTAKIDRRLNDHERRENKRFEMFKYVVLYADGESVEIPIRSEWDVDDFNRQHVEPIGGAMLGWVRPYENTDRSAVAYVKQWTNPRPEVEIKTVELVPGADPVGRAALLGITTARDSRGEE